MRWGVGAGGLLFPLDVGDITVFDAEDNKPVAAAVGFLIQELPRPERRGLPHDRQIRCTPGFAVTADQSYPIGA